MSGRGAPKKEDGQKDKIDKAITADSKVDAGAKPAAAKAASESNSRHTEEKQPLDGSKKTAKFPRGDNLPAKGEAAKKSGGSSSDGANRPTPAEDSSGGTKPLGYSKHSSELNRQVPTKPTASDATRESNQKISGNQSHVESTKPSRAADKKQIGESSKTLHGSKQSSESKSRRSPDASRASDKKKEDAEKGGKSLKNANKGASPKMDAAIVPKTSTEKSFPATKKATDQGKAKSEAKEGVGTNDGAQKGVVSAFKADGKDKSPSIKEADLKNAPSSSTAGPAALKEQRNTKKEATVLHEKDALQDKNVWAKTADQSQKSVSDKIESTTKRSPEKNAVRPKDSVDRVSPKEKKDLPESVPKSKLNNNAKESGDQSAISKPSTQEKKSEKDETQKNPAPEITTPITSLSSKQKMTQSLAKDLNVEGRENGRATSINKSPTEESKKKSSKDVDPIAATSHATEKLSPPANKSLQQNATKLTGKDHSPKSPHPEAAVQQMDKVGKKEPRDAKSKPTTSSTIDKQVTHLDNGRTRPDLPTLVVMDKPEAPKSIDSKNLQNSLVEQEASSKMRKDRMSPRTPEVNVLEFSSKDIQGKDVKSPKGEEPTIPKKRTYGTKSPLTENAVKNSFSATSPEDTRDSKQEFTADPQKMNTNEATLKASSTCPLSNSAKGAEEEKSSSKLDLRLSRDTAWASKSDRSSDSDSIKTPIMHSIRRPSTSDSRDTRSSPRPQFSPAPDGHKRFQFPPDPSKTVQSPSNKESPVQARSPASPLDKSDSSCESFLGRKSSSTRKTSGEHKTIVQMLQEAREEALPRGERKAADLKEYSKSEIVLPSSDGSRKEPAQQMTSSPNLKSQNGVTFRTEEVKKGSPGKIDIKSSDAKVISKSEVVLPAAATPDAKMLPEAEKQITSSPNLTSVKGRHVSSVEGLPDSIARSSPSVAIMNGKPQRGGDSRKGSVNSETAGTSEQVGCRARSATWSQTVVPASVASKRAEKATPCADPEWDKRWSSAGSDLLTEKTLGRVPSKKGSIGTVSIGTGKEWRSEGIAKAVSTPFNGATQKVGSTEQIKKNADAGKNSGDRRGWESEAGLVRHASSKGYTKFENPSGSKRNESDLKRDLKDLVSPSSSTASKGSAIEKASECSGSYHSVASSTHRRDSKSEVSKEEKREEKQESGDKVKLIGEEGKKCRQGFDVEIIVEMGGKRGSGKRRSREQHGVENQGADLALQEEAAGTSSAKGVTIRPYIDLWENEDKFSVANSQLPLNPSGEEDAGSVGSMLTTEPERGNWTGRFDFILSLLGYSVGLGNVWRFPYLCYNNGGGAFLIPFTIMLVIAGLPLMFMELSFGQYANLGPAAIYAKFCPLFHGLGYGMVIVSTVVMLYYNLIIAWTIFYMFASLNKQLPWENCEPEWSTLDCYSYEIADDCMDKNGTYYQRTCYNETEAVANNITHLAEIAEKRPPAEEYFNNYVLGLSKGIEETGEIRFSMALCLLLAWAIVFLCLSKGVQSSGKVVYFTALFPYVVLIMLFIRGVTLPGASTGILFYLTPDWKRLANAQVWGDAAVQIFFALSPAWGGLITLASYNKFSNNCYKDSLIVAVSNILTSFFAGFVIFSVIGFLAHELNVEVKKVVDQGAGLAFIVYPEVVTRLPVSPVWSLLFFVMLLTLGLDSQFALMETVTTAILDRFPTLREKKVWVVLVVAVFGYFGGLIFTTNSGMYWLQLMDKYAANWSVLLIAISECILIAWVYGADRFLRDVQEMIGPKSRMWMFFWCWMWKLVTPATLLFILFFNWVEYAPASYGEYIYPLWADAAGWVIGVFPVLVIIGVGIVKVHTAPEASLRDRFKRLLQPTPDWGPTFKRTSAPPTYDSIKNTIVLMNGLPVIQETHADGESLEDNTL